MNIAKQATARHQGIQLSRLLVRPVLSFAQNGSLYSITGLLYPTNTFIRAAIIRENVPFCTGYYVNAHVLLNLLNELMKREKRMAYFITFHDELNKFKDTGT